MIRETRKEHSIEILKDRAKYKSLFFKNAILLATPTHPLTPTKEKAFEIRTKIHAATNESAVRRIKKIDGEGGRRRRPSEFRKKVENL